MKQFLNQTLKEETLRFIEANGFTSPMPIQKEVIPSVLKGKDVIGLSQTGSGKTHAYLIPLMEMIDVEKRSVQAVITAPTRELATQIFEKAKVMQEIIPELSLRLFIGGQERSKDVEILANQQPHIVIGTPGRIKDLTLDDGLLRIDTTKILIVDEADMTLEFGFLDDVDAFAAKMGDDLQMLAFSATMPDQLKPFIKKYMHHPLTFQIGERVRFNPNIKHVLIPCFHHSFAQTIQSILPGFQPFVCLIFANTRQEASQIAKELKESGVEVNELHGDMTSRQRKQALKDLMASRHTYVVCTDLAARGMDIDTVTHVISCGFPSDLEYYIHRAGRTGRNQESGTCFALYHEEDDASIRSLMRYGIHFEHMRYKANGWQAIFPYGRKRLKQDDELEKKIAMIYTKKNQKVKPGYKKKRAKQIETIHRHKKREMIRAKIKEEKKAMFKERQIALGKVKQK